MRSLLKFEELAIFIGCILLLNLQEVEWWWYLLLFIGPDISMLGYLAGSRAGAWCYNFFHHKGIAIAVFILGLNNQIPGDIEIKAWLVNFGLILFGHASMDRVFGYGLKYENGFKFTHLGEIGKK